LRIRAAFEDQMYGRAHSAFISAILAVLSNLYRTALHLRYALYRVRILRRKALPCKVLSVGNITLGGTGKTPAVISLGAFLAARQKRPVIVSRGYGRRDESEILVVSDGSSVLADAASGGDEPVLIGSRLAGIPVVAGANRFEAAEYALERFNSNVVILDDGFQHLQLRRDIDIVLIDATDPFGNGKLFPAGILREPISSLQRAQAVIITKADQSASLDALKGTIRQNTAARIFTSFQRPVDVVNIRTGETRQLSLFRGAKTLVFSGIARPASFSSLLKALGAVISEEFIYPDHYVFQKSDLAAIFQKAADSRVMLIVTTEKDAVRLKPLKPEGIWALRIDLTLVEHDEWEKFLSDNL
jgi:tetraacyldisaccharide 4'-kinase